MPGGKIFAEGRLTMADVGRRGAGTAIDFVLSFAKSEVVV
jgi:hypothetical protein